MSGDTVAVHAPYWPIVTLIIGVCIGAALRGLTQRWEEQ